MVSVVTVLHALFLLLHYNMIMLSTFLRPLFVVIVVCPTTILADIESSIEPSSAMTVGTRLIDKSTSAIDIPMNSTKQEVTPHDITSDERNKDITESPNSRPTSETTSYPTAHTGMISHGTSSSPSAQPGVPGVNSALSHDISTNITTFHTDVPSSATVAAVNDSLTSSASSWSIEQTMSTQNDHVTSVTSSGGTITTRTPTAAATTATTTTTTKTTTTTAIDNSSERGNSSESLTDSTKNVPEATYSHRPTFHTVDYSPVTSSRIRRSTTTTDGIVITTLLDVTTETQDVHLQQSTTHNFMTSSIRRNASVGQSTSVENRTVTQTQETSDRVTATHYSMMTSEYYDITTASSPVWPIRTAVLAGSVAGISFVVLFLVVLVAVFACRSKVPKRTPHDSRVHYKDSDVRIHIKGPRRPPASPDGSDFDGSYIPLPRSAPPSALGGTAVNNIFKGSFPEHQSSSSSLNKSSRNLSPANNLYEKDSDQESLNGFAMSTFTARNTSYKGIAHSNPDN